MQKENEADVLIVGVPSNDFGGQEPGTPIEIRRTVRDAVAAVMRDPEVAKQLIERGYQTIAGTPEEHQAQTNALVSQWIEVGKKVNLKE